MDTLASLTAATAGSSEAFSASDFTLRQPADPAPLPSFPMHLLPPAWAAWLDATAAGADAPADYVALGLFSAVAGLGGAGVVAEPRGGWREPLVLWQALVGPSGAGKSPALAAVRRLVDAVETADDRGGSPCVVGEATPLAVASVVAGNGRGALLWRDELAAWLGRAVQPRARWCEAWTAAPLVLLRGAKAQPLRIDRFAASIVGALQPQLLCKTLAGADDGVAARFLYAWPARTRPSPRKIEPDDAAAEARLAAIARRAGTAGAPLVLTFDVPAKARVQALTESGRKETEESDGAMTGWLAKGPGTIVRLAAVLALLAWSESGTADAAITIDATLVEKAAALWSGYFKPHAAAALGAARAEKKEEPARRTLQWLQGKGRAQVSREDIRVNALGRTVDAAGADRVIARLEEAGLLRRAPAPRLVKAGRPCSPRWEVVAASDGAAANTANTVNSSEKLPPPERRDAETVFLELALREAEAGKLPAVGIALRHFAQTRKQGGGVVHLYQPEDVHDVRTLEADIFEAVGNGQLDAAKGTRLLAMLKQHVDTMRRSDVIGRYDEDEARARAHRAAAMSADEAQARATPAPATVAAPPAPLSPSPPPPAARKLEEENAEETAAEAQETVEAQAPPNEPEPEPPPEPPPGPPRALPRPMTWAAQMLADSVARARRGPPETWMDVPDVPGTHGESIHEYDVLRDYDEDED